MFRRVGPRSFYGSWSLRLLLSFFVFSQPMVSLAQQSWAPWTTVGSGGTVELANKDTATFWGPWVGVDSGAPASSTVTVRYNVVSVDGLIQGGAHHFMKVRYIDNGEQSRVIVYLKELDLATGSTTTRLTFDSNSFPQSASGQTQSVNGGCTFPFPPPPWGYNFDTKAYYLEAQLVRTGSSGSPWLAAIQLRDEYCL